MANEDSIAEPMPIRQLPAATPGIDNAIGINRVVVTSGRAKMLAHPFDPAELAPLGVRRTPPSTKTAAHAPRLHARSRLPKTIEGSPGNPGSSGAFPDDPRRNFQSDTAPYWCIGKVESFGDEAKIGTGALVGPRHILMSR